MGEQALQAGLVVPPHTFCWQQYQGRHPQAGVHDDVTVNFAAVLVPKDFPNQLPPLLLIDITCILFGFAGARCQCPDVMGPAYIKLYTWAIAAVDVFLEHEFQNR